MGVTEQKRQLPCYGAYHHSYVHRYLNVWSGSEVLKCCHQIIFVITIKVNINANSYFYISSLRKNICNEAHQCIFKLANLKQNISWEPMI
jgi:hypothetical protein